MTTKKLLEELRKALAKLIDEFHSLQEKRKLALTLVAALRLREKGQPVTPRTVTEEAHSIIKQTEGRIDWGINREEYTVALATDLLHELVEMGVLEPHPETLETLDKKYRFRSYEEEEDAAKEALKVVAPLLQKVV